MGLVGLAGMSSIAGCGGQSDTPETTEGSGDTTTAEGTTEATTAEPGMLPEGGHLKLASASIPPELIPLNGDSVVQYRLYDLIYAKMTKIDADGTVQPHMATDWEANDDATQWTFQLREGVTFTTLDKEMLAEDVKATIDIIQNEDVIPGAAGTIGPIESVDIVNDYAVQINYDKPWSPAPAHLTARFGNICPKEILDDDPEMMRATDYGTGPFNVDEYQPGERLSMVKNPNYYAEDEHGRQLPLVDRLTARKISEGRQRLNAVREGTANLFFKVSPTEYQDAKDMDGVVRVMGVENEWYGVTMPCGMEPFDDVRVRKALKYAMDKNQQLQIAKNGFGSIAANHPIAPAYNIAPEITDDPFGPEAKPEKAKDLLDDAGYPDGLDLGTYHYSATSKPSAERHAQIWQKNAANAGIEFDLQKVTRDQWLGEYWNDPQEYYWTSWSIKFPTMNMLQLAVHSEGPWNDAYFKNDEVDSLIEEAAESPDPDKRTSLVKDALQIVHEEGGWVIPFFEAGLILHRESLKNFRPSPNAYILVEELAVEE